MLNKILEISKRASKGGRVPIKIAILKIHEEPTETNKNGLHWKEEFIRNVMDTAVLMPICCEFADEEKSIPLGHGMTGELVNESGISEPVFENSDTVGVIESVEIEEFGSDDDKIKLLVGSGYLFNQRYPSFVKWVRKNHALNSVETSVEINGLPENSNAIIYEEDEPTTEFRTPKEFQFTGTAILSIEAADPDAIVLEIAEKKNKEEINIMEFDMNELKSTIVNTLMELNNKNTEIEKKIEELNSIIAERDAVISDKETKITELNASVEKLQSTLDQLNKDHQTYWEEREILEKELAKAKVAEKLGEMNEALGEFSESEKELVKDDIEKLTQSINACEKKEELNSFTSEINSLKTKLYAAIGVAYKKEKATVSEQNAAKQKEKEVSVEDIFSEMCSESGIEKSEEANIF